MAIVKIILRDAQTVMSQFGIDLLKLGRSVKGLPGFLRDYGEFRRQLKRNPCGLRMGRIYPLLEERFKQAGAVASHYFGQDLLVAQKISENQPVKHVDVGSRIDGFVAHVASFREIECLDIRELGKGIPNIRFRQVDITSDDFDLDDYCDSVSSLHAVEHFGLGRYGDKIDVNGHLKGLDNIYRLLKAGGKFYFSVPVGEQRIQFNAHRVFSLTYLRGILEERYRIDSFSYVNDIGQLFQDVELDSERIENNFGCHYGCGIFELSKRTRG